MSQLLVKPSSPDRLLVYPLLSPPPVLSPPCRVCSGRGSGLHYGVHTCEACKAFFRRCLTRQQKLKCNHIEFCAVLPGRKYGCPSCRYKKCLTLGMSKNAIVAGRCTHERKTRDIVEICGLELQSKLREDGSMTSLREQNIEMDKLVDHITNIHLTTTYNGRGYEDILMAQQSYIEHREMDRAVYGIRRPLCRREYHEIYSQTGLDIDGRRELVSRLIPIMDTVINAFLSFATSTPGFKSLPYEDKVSAIRHSIFGCWAFMFCHLYDAEHKVFVFPYERSIVMSFEDMTMFSDYLDTMDNLQEFVLKVQALELTLEEALLAASLNLMLTGTDCSIPGRQILLASADYLIETLQYKLTQTHDHPQQKLSQIIQAITDYKSLELINIHIHHNIIKDANGLPLPDLFVRLFGEQIR